eukprot:scaffold63851_cov37-Prasinocladus_malaysianus.AAC.1
MTWTPSISASPPTAVLLVRPSRIRTIKSLPSSTASAPSLIRQWEPRFGGWPCPRPRPLWCPDNRGVTGNNLTLSAVRAASATDSQADVVVVGAGIAGLACARALTQAGLSVVLIEAAEEVGGRVRTDEVDGFKLDHGFQIFLTSYPEARSVLDYDKLDLKPFYAGALVHWNGGFHRVADPVR